MARDSYRIAGDSAGRYAGRAYGRTPTAPVGRNEASNCARVGSYESSVPWTTKNDTAQTVPPNCRKKKVPVPGCVICPV